MRVKLSYVFLAALVIAVASCASFSRDANRTLAISFQTYDSTLNALSDMDRQGLLTMEQRDKAIELGRLYKLAHNGAVSALLQYQSDETPDAKQRYLTAAAEASKQLAALIEFAKPLLSKEI